MIITQTPLRISFAGGGSDLPSFYRRFGGAVVSTAIDKYVYVTVNKKFDDWIRLSYSRTEEVPSIDQIEHPIVRAALTRVGHNGGLEITSIADIPSRGTGLGSSSSFTAGFILALYAYHSKYISPADLAEESCTVEIDLCGELIGKQDQYAAAFGGFNFIRFDPDDHVSVEPLVCSADALETLQSNIITFYTGITRQASAILNAQSRQAESDQATQNLLQRMTLLAYQLREEIQSGNFHAFGEVLDEGWRLKREIHKSVSSSIIDDWYAAARRAGALGGKLLGAGGGGFLTFYAPPEYHNAIENALKLRRVALGFERAGSRVLLYHNSNHGSVPNTTLVSSRRVLAAT